MCDRPFQRPSEDPASGKGRGLLGVCESREEIGRSAFYLVKPEKVEGVTIEVIGGRKLKDLNSESFRVGKMYIAKNGKKEDRITFYFNSQIIIKNIPLKAYNYQINGKSSID